MNDDRLLSIGSFALLTGLTVTTLRHYDEVGVLPPAVVDPGSGYRRYRQEQVGLARLVRAMRELAMPVDEMRRALAEPDPSAAIERQRQELLRRAAALTALAAPERPTMRIVQATINVVDRDELIRFYETAFDASFQPETGSFVFGQWPSDDFFLLTLANPVTHPGAAGPARFGLVVDDLDRSHRRALDAGAGEVYPPVERPWKPRSSCLTDPAGNHIDLYQA